MSRSTSIAVAGFLLLAPLALAGQIPVDAPLTPPGPLTDCYLQVAPQQPEPETDPLIQRVLKYAQFAVRHRVNGLASYYSSFFDGRKTANGEVYRNRKYSAAHLTLPLGTWIEVTSRATGRKLRLRVNDRGPYAKKFCLDLSQAAAHYLGVDVAEDRHVDIRIIALPGDEPLPDDVDYARIEKPAGGGAIASTAAAIE